MSDRKYAVQVKDVKKSFFLPHHKNDSLKTAITQAFKPKEKGGSTFNALDGISFNVEKGDFFGVLGRNGSGKSTLLKIISEIYRPTSGSVKHDGKVVSFIELGVGFKMELSGRENVFLNGALLGFSKPEVEAMYDDIVEFAELEKFMDQKLKNYSSGMKVRLAFSVAIRAKADILILDEVLAVGDASFQKKCTDYFETLKNDGKTVILVTHSMGNVRKFCNKAIVIEDGNILYEGGANEAADTYNQLFLSTKDQKDNTPNLTNGIELNKLVLSQNGRSTNTIRFKDDFSLTLELDADDKFNDISMGLQILNTSGKVIVAVASKAYGGVKLRKGSNIVIFDVQNILKDGDYYVNLAIEDNQSKSLLIQKHKISYFKISGLSKTDYSRHGLVYPNVEVRYHAQD